MHLQTGELWLSLDDELYAFVDDVVERSIDLRTLNIESEPANMASSTLTSAAATATATIDAHEKSSSSPPARCEHAVFILRPRIFCVITTTTDESAAAQQKQQQPKSRLLSLETAEN